MDAWTAVSSCRSVVGAELSEPQRSEGGSNLPYEGRNPYATAALALRAHPAWKLVAALRYNLRTVAAGA